MEMFPDLRAPARAAGRLLSGAVSLATLPARGAIGLLDALLEQVSERVPPPGAASSTPMFGADAGGGPAPVTPSVARVPSAKRRRTTMRDPGPPAVLPGLLDPSVEPTAEPAHVETGETLVAEVADPGAENGAGAELHVEEPWHGYRALSAADIVDRLATQDPAELSVLLLYERSHRARKTVLDAAERELARRG